MRSFTEITEANADKLHRLLRHYGYKATQEGRYTHPEIEATATVTQDGWTHTAHGKTKEGKSRNGLDKHLADLHQASLF